MTTYPGTYVHTMFKSNLEKNPNLLTLDHSQINDAAQRVRINNALNDAKREDAKDENTLEREYNAFRLELFNIEQALKGSETRINEAAAKVRHLQDRIKKLKELKERAIAARNPREEGGCKHQIGLVEGELLEALDELAMHRRDNKNNVKALHLFHRNNDDAIEQLKQKIAAKYAAKPVGSDKGFDPHAWDSKHSKPDGVSK